MPPSPRWPHGFRVIPFDAAACPRPLERIVSRQVLERWREVDRSTRFARIVAVPDHMGDGWAGAALVMSRPHTAYVKIVDAVGDVPAAVEAVVAHAQDLRLTQVKWEGWTADPADAEALGFVPLQVPLGSAEDGARPDSGYVRWLTGHDAEEPPYYRQTTNFTCGAVVALIAQVHAGAAQREFLDRRAELTLWRDATNFPACEPVGLGVAVRRAWPASAVAVSLDVDRPVVLGFYSESEREWRAVLQHASRKDAADLGVPIDSRRLSMADVRSAIARGELVLLLISSAAMLGVDVPHWVLCHGAVPDAIVIQDPWVDDAAGETWVDAHLLPVPDSSLDAMSAMEDERYRGAVRVGAPAAAPSVRRG